MRRTIAILLLAALLVPDWAQAKGCFSKSEETAEQIVRQGLRLREGARGCDGPPWNMGTQPLWDDIDQRFGPYFAAQTNIRRNAFLREFKNDADNRLEQWDGRIVMHFRHYPLSETYCASIKSMLQETQKRGWPALRQHALKAADEVKMDYRACMK